MEKHKKRVFSGVQPSGEMHIGNYIGALKNFLQYQGEEYDPFFCVVDLHSITVPKNPVELRKNILEIAKVYLAIGIDPKKATIFIQSSRPEHSELAWILGCFTSFGELSRMTQFKEKSRKEMSTAGLFNYPILMAADILLYDTEIVPVGDDQKQHLELTRNIAERINKKYQENVFVVPRADIKKVGARIMSLNDPNKKMSKSDNQPFSYISLRDDNDTIRDKIKKAVTDSGKEIIYSKEKPALANLLTIYSAFVEEEIPEIVARYKGRGYADFKKDLAEVIIQELAPIKDNLTELDNDPAIVHKILAEGSQKAALIAASTISRIKEVVGLG